MDQWVNTKINEKRVYCLMMFLNQWKLLYLSLNLTVHGAKTCTNKTYLLTEVLLVQDLYRLLAEWDKSFWSVGPKLNLNRPGNPSLIEVIVIFSPEDMEWEDNNFSWLNWAKNMFDLILGNNFNP